MTISSFTPGIARKPRPGFHGTLAASPYHDGRTWWLDRRLLYVRRSGEEIVVPKGFETDFASCPRILQNIIPPWGTYGWAAIVHDDRYWRQLCTRAEADAILLEAMELLGNVPEWQRIALYGAVRAFGWIAWADNQRLALEGYSRIRGMRGPANRPAWTRHKLTSLWPHRRQREIYDRAVR